MPFAPVTVLGGLPVVAKVWFSGPDYFGEYDAGVDRLYWMVKESWNNPIKHGKALSDKIMDRLPDYWEADVIEQVSDWLAQKDYEEKEKCTLA